MEKERAENRNVVENDKSPQSLDTGLSKKNGLNDTVISLEKCITIPAFWDSEDSGEAWEWGDYIIILQKNPATMIDFLKAMQENRPLRPLKGKNRDLRYLFALTLFYKKGRNPSGIDSSRPAEILTIEQVNVGSYFRAQGKLIPEGIRCDSNGWDDPIFCTFVPNIHFNIGALEVPLTRDNVKKCFFSYLSSRIPGTPTFIGTIEDAKRVSCNGGTLKVAKPEYKPESARRKAAPRVGWSLIFLIIFALVGAGIFFDSDYWAWHNAQNSEPPASFRQYLIDKPDGNHRKDALEKLHKYIESELHSLVPPYNEAQIKTFMDKYPEFSAESVASCVYEDMQKRDSLEYYRIYIGVFPNGPHREMVFRNIDRIENELWEKNKNSDSEEVLIAVREKVNSTKIKDSIQARLNDFYKDFSFASRKNTKEGYERFIKMNPNAPEVEIAKKKIIDCEVAAIAADEHGELPPSFLVAYGDGSTATIELENQTEYTLVVRYSGPDSKKEEVLPRCKQTITIAPGCYKIAVSVKQGNVRPFFGTNEIKGGRYVDSYYIVSYKTHGR